jgi:putative CocE/NonD family hydrolase
MGIVQWAIADQLDALAPSVTASQFRGMAYGGGSISLDTAVSWAFIVAAQERRLAPLHLLLGLRRRLPKALDHLPLGELDTRVAGRPIPFFHEWFEQVAPDDPYWATRDFSADVGRVTAPVQLVGGWYDIFLPWLIEDHLALRRAGRETQLIIGPWTHMAPALLGASTREGLGWLRAHLLGDRRMLHASPVRVWVTGEERWRDLPEWPPPGTRAHRLHLLGGGGLGEREPGPSEPDRFRYDPAAPTPAVGGPVLLARHPVLDNRDLEARPDVLTFTGAPLEREVDALGPVTADIWERSTREHEDLFVRVCDVQPSGASLNVTDALVRLAPGEPATDADGARRMTFALWPIAHRFRRGHRIRVQVSGGAHPRYARNPGTGEPPATGTRLVASEHEVLHDPAHPSAVVLSVGG